MNLTCENFLDCVDDVLMETLGIRTYSQRALVIKCFGKLYEIVRLRLLY